MIKTYAVVKTAFLPICSLLALLAMPVGLKAGTITDLGTTRPTAGSSDQSDLNPDSTTGADNSWTNSGVVYGQSFTTGANSGGYTVNDFILEVNYEYGYGGQLLTIPVSFYQGSGSSGTQVGSTESDTISGFSSADTALNNHYLEFTLSTPLTLAATTKYSFALGNQTEGGGGAIKWFATTDSSTYSGGSAFVTGGSAGVSDFVFDVGLTPVSSPVPEPRTTAAMLLGGVAFLIFARRRRRAIP